jgi:hypothetical protein
MKESRRAAFGRYGVHYRSTVKMKNIKGRIPGILSIYSINHVSRRNLKIFLRTDTIQSDRQTAVRLTF